jgi:hypothetical protein
VTTTIHEGSSGVYATRYDGGQERGLCIQITSSWKSDAPGAGLFVCAEYDAVVAMARDIVAFDRREKRKADRVICTESTKGGNRCTRTAGPLTWNNMPVCRQHRDVLALADVMRTRNAMGGGDS